MVFSLIIEYENQSSVYFFGKAIDIISVFLP